MFIPHVIRSYQSQTYPHKELVIVDNGNDATESLIPFATDPTIRYARVAGQLTTGEMRNLCAKYANGEYICHFDSDDWSAPERVTDQVLRLGMFGVVTGYHSMLFYDERDGKCYHWQIPQHPIRFALGTSLCYRREWWRHHPFQKLRIGEDVMFWRKAMHEAQRLVPTADAQRMMVARVHGDQTCRKSLKPNSYRPVPTTYLPHGYPRAL